MSKPKQKWDGKAVSRRIRARIQQSHDGNIQQAATDIGVNYNLLYDVVKGRASRGPSLYLIVELARYYGCTLEDIVYEDAPC